jgi:diketogulonate reductase-like aldo/keto reductase
MFSTNRRKIIKAGLATAVLAGANPSLNHAQMKKDLIKKAIPSTGENIPVIGLGTSRTFDVDKQERQFKLLPVLDAFFSNGGSMIDSSPMYGASEATVGRLLDKLERPKGLFSATKVWTDGKQAGIDQMENSLSLWGLEQFDLMQIHNLRDWKVHLKTLRDWKKQGKIRYIGITTSHNRFHEELSEIMKNETLDFVQFSYNIGNRTSENTLLPIAFDRGIAVLINRPFQRGGLFSKVKGIEVPEWATEIGIKSWGQFFLKYIVSHPAVSCVIPATSKARHALDNMQAGFGHLPDAAMRERMLRFIEAV